MKRILVFVLLAAMLLSTGALAADEPAETIPAGFYALADESQYGWLKLYPQGFGMFEHLDPAGSGQVYLEGLRFTDGALEIEEEETEYVCADGVLSFERSGVSYELVFQGEDAEDPAGAGETADANFTGMYKTGDGARLVLTPDGQGMFADEDGFRPAGWFRNSHTQLAWPMDHFLVMGSYLSGLEWADQPGGEILLTLPDGTDAVFSPIEEYDEDGTEIYSAPDAGNFRVLLPTDGWHVSDTDYGVSAALTPSSDDVVQILLMGLPIPFDSETDSLDEYTDLFLTGGFNNLGEEYPADKVERADYPVPGCRGRYASARTATYPLTVDSVIWYDDELGQLYFAMTVSTDSMRDLGLSTLDVTALRIVSAEAYDAARAEAEALSGAKSA